VAYLDNSAGRLHQVLEQLALRSPNSPLPKSWAIALGDEELRGLDLQRQVMAVVDLADQARYDTLKCVEDGEENAPSHVRASLAGPQVLVPLQDGRLALGTWQGIFFCEFDGPRKRKVYVTPLT